MSSCSVNGIRYTALVSGLLVSSLLGSGCATLCDQVRWCPYCPPDCQLAEDATDSQVITHLNSNTRSLKSWRSTSASILARSKGGLPVTLAANLAVSQPRHFRLRASLLGSNEVDLGSNAERFWFWIRRSEQRHVITVGHEELPKVKSQLSLPFEPVWLIEALGVVPLNPQEWTVLHSRPEERQLFLAAEQRSPRGVLVRKQLVVDTCQGVITEQSLFDESSRLIARARMSDHRKDAETGIVLPRRIELEWPEAEIVLTIKLRQVEINPVETPAATWQVPRNLGAGTIDLATRRELP